MRYHTVISAEVPGVGDWQDGRTIWQAELLSYSLHRAGVDGPLTVCMAGGELAIQGAETFAHPNYRFTDRADYPPFNRPMGMWDWWQATGGPREDVVCIIDPDCVFLRHVDGSEFLPTPHVAVAQDWTWQWVLEEFASCIPGGQAVGIPIFIRRDDLERLLPWWVEHTRAIYRHNSIERQPWISEMGGYIVAAREAGVDVTHRLVDYDCDAILHYFARTDNATVYRCLQGWDKITYRPWEPIPSLGPPARQELAAILADYRAYRERTGQPMNHVPELVDELTLASPWGW